LESLKENGGSGLTACRGNGPSLMREAFHSRMRGESQGEMDLRIQSMKEGVTQRVEEEEREKKKKKKKKKSQGDRGRIIATLWGWS